MIPKLNLLLLLINISQFNDRSERGSGGFDCAIDDGATGLRESKAAYENQSHLLPDKFFIRKMSTRRV